MARNLGWPPRVICGAPEGAHVQRGHPSRCCPGWVGGGPLGGSGLCAQMSLAPRTLWEEADGLLERPADV